MQCSIRPHSPATGETLRWEQLRTTAAAGSTVLGALTGATATAVGHKVFVFGGQDPLTGKCFNDVNVLDTGESLKAEISQPCLEQSSVRHAEIGPRISSQRQCSGRK